ncbi:(2Fe-2S)-binding protein [Puia sp. P3]|uniref:(2Fe-2S)-binding protein n=1 Tax=Puia sp. P3 TaxID=3423952 RepID=UPI003D67A392
MLTLQVNQQSHQVDADPDMPLLWVLRDLLGLIGTKYGCGVAQCGACTVHLNGEAVRSCVTKVGRAAGGQVTTIEGLSPNNDHPLQLAWIELGVPQCGYCQSGQLMAAAVLLRENPRPTDRGHRQCHVGQPLPLRHLCPHPPGPFTGRPACSRKEVIYEDHYRPVPDPSVRGPCGAAAGRTVTGATAGDLHRILRKG